MIYNTLAQYYDALVKDDQATKEWLEFTMKHSSGNEILELACGSGEISNALYHQGVSIVATDFSKEMGQQLQKKYPSVPFEEMDMRKIETTKSWDAILCYCDSINYLRTTQELLAVFEGVKKALKPGGVFLFDVHSSDRLEEFEEMYIEEGIVLDVPYQWTIQCENRKLNHHFAFYTEEAVLEESHCQTIFSIEEINHCLEQVGLSYEIMTDFNKMGVQKGEKYFYIARRDK